MPGQHVQSALTDSLGADDFDHVVQECAAYNVGVGGGELGDLDEQALAQPCFAVQSPVPLACVDAPSCHRKHSAPFPAGLRVGQCEARG
jgi:hypothetical protein